VPIDVGENILDEDLAPELLAEKADVAADDRTEVEQHGRFLRRQRRQEFLEGLGREDGIVSGGRRRSWSAKLGVALPGRETI
jgi:hypothetical protein